MKCIETEFKSNANSLGLMNFHMVLQGVNPAGKHVYIYHRTKLDGTPFSFEVFVPQITKAGTVQKFPNGSTRTIEEDTENYPGTSVFGHTAWSCATMVQAQARFDELTKVDVVPSEDAEAEANAVETSTKTSVKPAAPKAIKPTITTIPAPGIEFSTQELADLNHVAYPIASVYIRDAVERKEIAFKRDERRNPRGKDTRLFVAQVVQPT